MKRAHLQLVANNVGSARVRTVRGAAANNAAAEAAHVDFQALAAKSRHWFAVALLILGAPFRLVAAVGRMAVATGRGFFTLVYRVVMGTIGLAMIGIVGYGLLRVLLHPLFAH